MPCQSCSRREFLFGTCKVMVAGVALSGLQSCSSPNAFVKGPIRIDITDPANAVLARVGGAVYIADPNDSQRPIIVFRAATDGVIAISSRCTHQGGPVGLPVNSIGTCPWHGSQFDIHGKVVTGPATSSLNTFTATISGNIVTISW
jgi:cytochrome b6-f complex iron-sulfur subunit